MIFKRSARKHNLKKAVLSLVAVALASASATNFIVASGEELSYGLDYSRSGYGYVSVSAPDFLERVLSAELSSSERQYLNTNADFTLKYNDKIAGKYIQSELRDNSLTVTPSPFFYEAVNGRTVAWEPVAVNGNELSSGEWSTTVTDDDNDFVTVTYKTSLAVSATDVNGILNKYYTGAKQASEKLAYESQKYENAYADYLEDYEKYQQYLTDFAQYEEDLAVYEKYRDEYSEWSVKNSLYQEYLKEQAKYEKEFEEYLNYEQLQKEYDEAYIRYQQYLREKANYEKQYSDYLEKLSDPNLAKQRAHLEILDYIFEPVLISGDNARTIYGAMMGNTATYMLSVFSENEQYLGTNGFPEREPVLKAEAASKQIRSMFEDLAKIKDDEDRYLFYISTYESLKSNLTVFFQAMDYCYSKCPMVHVAVSEMERTEQVQVLLAQLYYICAALNNETVKSYYNGPYYERFYPELVYDFDSTYRIDGKTPAQVVNGVTLADTDDSEPIAGGYIAVPVEPVEPEEVEEPASPQKVQKPIAPEAVENPGEEPATVFEPSAPDEVKEPVEPKPYIPTEEEQALADHYSGGTVVYRNELTEDYIYFAECQVEHYFRNAQLLTVAFYLDEEDEQYEWLEEDVQAGSAIEYGGRTPEMTVIGHTCTFVGWRDAEGNPVDINNVPASGGYLKLYPRFNITVNKYDVIWVVDGVEYQAKAYYNTKPDYLTVFNGDPVKANDDDGREYRFIGWDREIALIDVSDEPVYYYARFESSFLITFKVNSEDYVISYWNGEMPEYEGATPKKPADSRYYYTFSGWNKQIVAAQKDATYVAQFEGHYILSIGSGGAEIELNDGVYYADCTKASQNTFDLSVLVGFAANEGAGIVLRTSATTLTFTATQAYLLNQSGAHTVTINYSQTGSTSSGYGIYRFSVDFTGKGDAAYTDSFTITATGKFDALHSYLYRVDAEGNVETRYTYSDNKITFSMRSGYVYEIRPQYTVSVLSSEDVTVTVNATMASEKQTIIISLDNLVAGKYVQKLYAIDSNGKEISISSDNTFVMPADDVKVGVTCDFIQYTVVFKVDGEVIATRTCRYGEEVTAPTPVKAPDSKYSYTFIGWDKELTPVTKNIEYNARFSAEPLPVYDPPELSFKMQLALWVLGNIVWLSIVAVILLVLFAVGIILIARHRKKLKNRRKST